MPAASSGGNLRHSAVKRSNARRQGSGHRDRQSIPHRTMRVSPVARHIAEPAGRNAPLWRIPRPTQRSIPRRHPRRVHRRAATCRCRRGPGTARWSSRARTERRTSRARSFLRRSTGRVPHPSPVAPAANDRPLPPTRHGADRPRPASRPAHVPGRPLPPRQARTCWGYGPIAECSPPVRSRASPWGHPW